MSTIQLIGLSKEDLKDLFGDVLKSEIRTLKKQMEPKQGNDYLTRKEVSQMLKIDLSSVHNWSKK